MSLARAVTFLCLAAILVVLAVLAAAGGWFGLGSTEQTCEAIHWRGSQCEALRPEPR